MKFTAKKRKPYGKFSIYALIDPDTHEVFYVGRSKNASIRKSQHIKEASSSSREKWSMYIWGLISKEKTFEKTSNEKKSAWIRSIEKRNKLVVVKILDEWYAETLSDANRLEDAWIAEMKRRGEPLTNLALSHRTNPNWYTSNRFGLDKSVTSSPMEYIERLKAGKTGSTANRLFGKISKSKEYEQSIVQKEEDSKKKAMKRKAKEFIKTSKKNIF